MRPRFDYQQETSGAYRATLGLERFVRNTGR